MTPEERRRVTEPFLRQAEKELQEAREKHRRFGSFMGKYSLMVLNNGIEDLNNEVVFLKKMMED